VADDKLQHAVTRNMLLGVLVACAALTLIAIAAPVTTPIIMAAFLASVLRSPVRMLVRWRLPRPLLEQPSQFLMARQCSGR